jgi:predicted acylesterase/phospholipase RssA
MILYFLGLLGCSIGGYVLGAIFTKSKQREEIERLLKSLKFWRGLSNNYPYWRPREELYPDLYDK